MQQAPLLARLDVEPLVAGLREPHAHLQEQPERAARPVLELRGRPLVRKRRAQHLERGAADRASVRGGDAGPDGLAPLRLNRAAREHVRGPGAERRGRQGGERGRSGARHRAERLARRARGVEARLGRGGARLEAERRERVRDERRERAAVSGRSRRGPDERDRLAAGRGGGERAERRRRPPRRGDGERRAPERGVDRLPLRLAQERLRRGRRGPGPADAAREHGRARRQPGRLLEAPELDRPRRRLRRRRQRRALHRERGERAELGGRHGLRAAPRERHRAHEPLERVLEPREGREIAGRHLPWRAGRPAADPARLDEAGEARRVRARGPAARQRSHERGERVERSRRALERGALGGRRGRRERGRAPPQRLGRRGPPVERASAVEERRERSRHGRQREVGRAREPLRVGPIEPRRRGERVEHEADRRRVGEREAAPGRERDPRLRAGGGERGGRAPGRGRDERELARRQAALEEPPERASRRDGLPGLARARLGGHGALAPGGDEPPAAERGEERRDPGGPAVPLERGEDDLDLLARRELVERLEPAEERLRRGARVRAVGEVRQVDAGPARAPGERRQEIPLGGRDGPQPVEDEQIELLQIRRERATPGRDGGRARRPGAVDHGELPERVLVSLERRRERAEALRGPALEPRRRRPRRGRVHLSPAQLPERARERRGEPAVRRELRERAAGSAARPHREEALGERREHRPPIAGRREDVRDEAVERHDRRAEQDPALCVAQAARPPRRGERRRDDAERGHGPEDRPAG